MSLCQSWTDHERIIGACPTNVSDALAEVDTVLLEEAGLAASEALYELSGRRWSGLCADTVRPCPCRPGEPDGWTPATGWNIPYGWNASWGWFKSGGWCSCDDGPTCRGCAGAPSQIRLGGRPIAPNSVVVEIDGVPLSPSAWQILDGVWLVRVDGERWPAFQDFTVADGDLGTWSVSYEYGLEPTNLGVLAATALARELVLDCSAPSLCRLPARVLTVTRQQVTLAIRDPMEFLKSGTTGIYVIDLFLGSDRYGRAHRTATFANPDRPRFVRRVTDQPGS